jgi:hypothetical protein
MNNTLPVSMQDFVRRSDLRDAYEVITWLISDRTALRSLVHALAEQHDLAHVNDYASALESMPHHDYGAPLASQQPSPVKAAFLTRKEVLARLTNKETMYGDKGGGACFDDGATVTAKVVRLLVNDGVLHAPSAQQEPFVVLIDLP